MFGISTTRLSSYRAIHSHLQDFTVIHFRSVSSSRDVIAAGSFSFLPREDLFESFPLLSDISNPSHFQSLHFRSPYPRVLMSSRAALHFSPVSLPLSFCGLLSLPSLLACVSWTLRSFPFSVRHSPLSLSSVKLYKYPCCSYGNTVQFRPVLSSLAFLSLPLPTLGTRGHSPGRQMVGLC